ncbi:MAG: hypothetical protein Q3979_05505 [Actinomycetaceae bacterium]|nr:hypothetical protein [Actinomycetaceae bacterium]
MARSRRSARDAGTRFERLVADYLAAALDDDRIDRRAKTGAKDRGDIAGLRHMGGRIVAECKNTARLELSAWLAEAETERGNDDALAGIVIHKRHGKAAAGDQLVTMTLADLAAILTGIRKDNQ